MADFLETVDKMFESEERFGIPIVFAHFDRRALLSFEQVASEVEHVTGEPLTLEDLTRMGGRGWIPILSNANDTATGIGFPLYTSSRIVLLLELERDGFPASELYALAKWEESMIDAALTADDLAYLNDDLEIVIRYMKDMLLKAEERGKDTITMDSSGMAVPRDQFEHKIQRYEQFQTEGIPETHKRLISKMAFRLRAVYEMVRFELLDMHRAMIYAGYSPFLVCKSTWRSRDQAFLYTGPGVVPSTTPKRAVRVPDDNFIFTSQGIYWKETIEAAVAYAEEDVPTIRMPGFRLHGDEIVSTQTLIPKDYERLWKEHNLNRYLLEWSAIRGERRCLNCLSKLPVDPSNRRMYCSEKCRNALKQKRHRLANPEATFKAQLKYWSALEN
jgi:hypothetical protein